MRRRKKNYLKRRKVSKGTEKRKREDKKTKAKVRRKQNERVRGEIYSVRRKNKNRWSAGENNKRG